jgi:hypothetical protein
VIEENILQFSFLVSHSNCGQIQQILKSVQQKLSEQNLLISEHHEEMMSAAPINEITQSNIVYQDDPTSKKEKMLY